MKAVKIKLKKRPDKYPSLVDAKRKVKRSEGGELKESNIDVVEPIQTMKEANIYREREESLEKLKILIDAREQVRKLINSTNNRILAIRRRTDVADNDTLTFLRELLSLSEKKLNKLDRRIKTHLLEMPHPIAQVALGVPGVGPITVAYMLAYVDITKAEHASSLWAYCGLDKPSHKRKVKNQAGGGNQTLRTVLYTMATSMEKTQKKSYSGYYKIYDEAKKKLAASNKITETRITGKTGVHERAWKDVSPGHRRGAALRKLMQHYLSDFWYVWRTLEGLPTPKLYVEEHLGHTDIIMPEERGWVYLPEQLEGN